MAIMTAYIRQRTKQLLGEVDRLLEDPARREVLRVVVNRLDKVAESTDVEEQKIQRNTNLSPEGRRTELRKLATKVDLKFLESELGKSTESYNTMTGVLFTTAGQRSLDLAMGRDLEPIEPDAVIRHLREQEIRIGLKEKSQSERDGIYLRALQTGDRETARALTNPPGGPLVSADMKRRADTEHAQQQFPKAYENLVQIGALREQLVGLTTLTNQWLAGLGTQP